MPPSAAEILVHVEKVRDDTRAMCYVSALRATFPIQEALCDIASSVEPYEDDSSDVESVSRILAETRAELEACGDETPDGLFLRLIVEAIQKVWALVAVED